MSDNSDMDKETQKAIPAPETPVPAIPDNALIIIPVRNTVLFPGMVLPLALGRERSIAAAQEAARSERPVGVLLQRDPHSEVPGPDDLYTVGTVASVLRYVTGADKTHHVICQGEQRFRALEFLDGYPFPVARVEYITEQETSTTEIDARAHRLKQQAIESLRMLPQPPDELVSAIEGITSPTAMADLVASFIDIKPDEKQAVLETIELQSRLDKVIELLSHRIQVLRLSQEINKQTQKSVDQRQREYLLREQLKTIQKELGETDTQAAEVDELTRAIADAGMPPEAEDQAKKELARLERMPEAAAEYSMVRTYLDWLSALPWSKLDAEDIDIAAARRILEEDHYGLEKIKRRILEYLAVRKLNPHGKSPILCFVGPPGVGKTSLGQSIARALGLKFVRASLGGLHDEAEIRGHRRTYVGALPGNVIQSIRRADDGSP